MAVGVQVTTGDPDDPNSADVTLSNFDDDLQISLDQLYTRLQYRDVQFVAGKIPQPLTRTDLLWDADVSPQGVSATYATQFLWATSLKTTALYFVIDESLTGRTSDMAGLQAAWNYPAASAWRYELAVGYYDYSLRSVVGADAGDFRSNAIDETGNYVSDFNLLNIIGGVTYQGVGLRWPVRVTTDYVRNFGAAISADTAYSADVVIGRRYGEGLAIRLWVLHSGHRRSARGLLARQHDDRHQLPAA